MIRTDYLKTMARYGRWQNAAQIKAAEALTDTARRTDRGAFFGSIHKTMSHLIWGDAMWMRRFDDLEPPSATGPEAGAEMYGDWDALKAARDSMDAAILDWAERETQDRLDGDLTWYSGLLKREVSKPMGMLVTHMFNHQTHHRGQIHAMLTADGATLPDTDLFLMPEDA